MTDAERFDVVLGELKGLLRSLGDLAEHVVLVGAQVIAVQARAAGRDGSVSVTTDTGIALDRGFTFESDLLIDTVEAERIGDEIPRVLRDRGFERSRDYRWKKDVDGVEVEIDLFARPDCDPSMLPTGMTLLPQGDLALARARRLSVPLHESSLEILVPDPAGFLAMKIESKKRLRPRIRKDSFDMFAYTVDRGARTVAAALASLPAPERDMVLQDLASLFEGRKSPGVEDVVAYAGAYEEGELLARSVIDLFDEVRALARES